MKKHKMKQKSEEWFEVRKGKMTASNAQAVAANGKGLESYIIALLAEKYSNNTEKYSNGDMDRGVELEEQARMTYEIEREKVEEIGFIEMDKLVGCSPDGLVGEDGGIEIKCPDDKNFFKILLGRENAIDTKYKWQCQMFLLVSKRKWIDFVAYNPNFDKNLIVVRIEKDSAMQDKLIAGIATGKKLIKDLEKRFIKSQKQ